MTSHLYMMPPVCSLFLVSFLYNERPLVSRRKLLQNNRIMFDHEEIRPTVSHFPSPDIFVHTSLYSITSSHSREISICIHPRTKYYLYIVYRHLPYISRVCSLVSLIHLHLCSYTDLYVPLSHNIYASISPPPPNPQT